MLTTGLVMSILGYPFILPDMINMFSNINRLIEFTERKKNGFVIVAK